MIEALLSFLGGSAFRMVFGQVSDWLSKRQDHKHELESMELQSKLEGDAHTRNLESLRLQSELGIKEITVKTDSALAQIDAQGFYEASVQAMKPSGIRFVDGWNGIIRPMCATIVISLWVSALYNQGWKIDDWDRNMIGAVLGFFFAARDMAKRGK